MVSTVATRTVETQIEIKAPVEAVWKALTDAKELERWFPLNARVKPGVGGSVWLSWGPPFEGEGPIEIWEPNRRLKTGWPMWGEMPSDGARQVAVEYVLEAHGGMTLLRLVHSGFGVDAKWDKEYDGVRRGWAFELRGLRHYLENHRGKERRVIWSRKSTELPIAEAMSRVIGPEGRVLRGKIAGLKEGEAYSLELAGDRTIEGAVAVNNPPRSFSGSVAGLNNAFFRCEIEACGPDGKEQVWLWFSTYDVPEAECEKLEGTLEPMLERALGLLGRANGRKIWVLGVVAQGGGANGNCE